jgi:fructokinase
MNAKVWVLGDAVVDLLPESKGRLLQCPGGAPANVAVGVARLGGNSGFIGASATIPLVVLCAIPCNRSRSMSATCALMEHRTSTVVVDLDDEGNEPLPLWCAPARICFAAEDLPPFAANEWLHVCSIALSAEPSRSTTFAAMERIKLAGGRVSFDPNIRADLWQDQNCCTPVSTAPCVWRTW